MTLKLLTTQLSQVLTYQQFFIFLAILVILYLKSKSLDSQTIHQNPFKLNRNRYDLSILKLLNN